MLRACARARVRAARAGGRACVRPCVRAARRVLSVLPRAGCVRASLRACLRACVRARLAVRAERVRAFVADACVTLARASVRAPRACVRLLAFVARARARELAFVRFWVRELVRERE